MRACVLLGLLLLVAMGCGRTPLATPSADGGADPNAVLGVGDLFEFRNSNGTMRIRADSHKERTYTWDGVSRSAALYSRTEPWHGALGLYFPGPGNHWADHKGVSRGVLTEQTRDFASIAEFSGWFIEMKEWYDAKCSPDGLVAGWTINLSRRELNVELWRVTIQGEPPTGLNDSSAGWFTWTKAK